MVSARLSQGCARRQEWSLFRRNSIQGPTEERSLVSGNQSRELFIDAFTVLWLLLVLGIFFRQPMVTDLFSLLFAL